MVQKEASKEKEAEVPVKTQYDTNREHDIKINQQNKTGQKVIRSKDTPFEVNRQGIVRFYASQGPGFENLTNNNWSVFCHEIRQHSGRHRHQGGINLFVTQGKGYSVVNGKRYDWSEGDLILLPILKGGCEHQHFNLDGKPSRWVALRNHRSSWIGNFMEQRETFSMWKEKDKDKEKK